MPFLYVMIGNLLFTTAYAFIAVPKGIINGGVTSFAMVLGKITGLDIALLTNALLGLLLLSCWVFLGKRYFFSALFSGACYMIFFTSFYQMAFEINLPLAACVPLSAVLVGIGYYFCIIAKSTSVGTDTIALIVHNKKPRWEIATIMYACNIAVLLLGLLTYGWTSVAAGIVFAGIQSLTLHFLLKNLTPQRI